MDAVVEIHGGIAMRRDKLDAIAQARLALAGLDVEVAERLATTRGLERWEPGRAEDFALNGVGD